jgi:5-methylcytosine-specific restriction endonuclease McrA
MSRETFYMRKRRRAHWHKNPHCHYCGNPIASPDEATLDHKQPKSRGGKNSWANIVLSCFRCNNEKGDKSYDDYTSIIWGGEEINDDFGTKLNISAGALAR